MTYIDHSSIRVRTAEKDPSLEDHWHSAAEITLMLQGEATYSLPDKTYRLTDGQILIVPADCTHSLKETEGAKRIQFQFEPTYLLHLKAVDVVVLEYSEETAGQFDQFYSGAANALNEYDITFEGAAENEDTDDYAAELADMTVSDVSFWGATWTAFED